MAITVSIPQLTHFGKAFAPTPRVVSLDLMCLLEPPLLLPPLTTSPSILPPPEFLCTVAIGNLLKNEFDHDTGLLKMNSFLLNLESNVAVPSGLQDPYHVAVIDL